MTLSAGNQRSLDSIYREHHQMVFKTAFRFCNGDREWAKDRVHDAFIKLAQHISGLDSLDEIGGWLYRVTVNLCLADLRKKNGWRKILDRWNFGSNQETSSEPRRELMARRDIGSLGERLSKLPELQRALMMLIYVEDYSQIEAAKELGVSKGYMSKLHTKALSTLKSQEWELAHAGA